MGRNCDLCHHPSTPEVDESGHRYDKCTNPSCGAYYDELGVSFKQPEGWKDWMKGEQIKKEAPFISLDDLWEWIDQQSNLIYRDFDDEALCLSEHYKMMLCGRKDMLERLMDFMKGQEHD